MAFQMPNLFSHVALAVFCLLSTVSVANVQAQEKSSNQEKIAATRYHETPFAVQVNRVTQRDAVRYLRNMSEQLSIGAKVLKFYDRSEAGKMVSDLDRPLSGSLFFLAKGLVPSATGVTFSEVKDEAEYEKLVRQVGRGMAENSGTHSSQLSGKDGKHKLSNSWTNRFPISNDADQPVPVETPVVPQEGESTTEASNSVTISVGTGSGVQVSQIDPTEGRIVEEDGIRYRETTIHFDQYFRYHGNLMYQAQDAAVWDMTLPTLDGVLKDASRDVDLGAEVYLERIPFGLKNLGWNMLYGGLSTQMQQRDEESDIDYNFRSSGGKLALAMAKAGMFDAEHVQGGIKLADNTNPIRSELSIRAKGGSELSKRLTDFSSAQSRFAPLLNDGAAVTLHSSIKLPEESVEVIKAGAEWMKDQLIQQAGTDVELVLGSMEIAETMVSVANRNNLELFAKLGWTKTSGGVIYGGMQVDENPELLKSVLTLLTPESTPRDILDRFAITQRDDLEVIEFHVPDLESPPEFPIRLTHMYIAHANSCLWFCVGAENSFEILKASIARCADSGLRANTRVLSGEVNFDTWMAYPQDDPTGLTRIPQLADSLLATGLASGFGLAVQASDGSGDAIDLAPTARAASDSLMQRVINLGGRKDIRVYLDSSSGGLILHADIGKAIGTYLAARYMQAIEGFVGNMQVPPGPSESAPVSDAVEK